MRWARARRWLEEEAPPWLALAEDVSLAVRVTPALLRRTRLEAHPGLPAGAESAVWRSPLVSGGSPLGVSFAPEAAAWLRSRLSAERVAAAWGRMQALRTEHTPPLVPVEEELVVLGLLRPFDQDRAEALLAAVLAGVRAGDRPALAAWARRVLPSLPDAVRRTPTAWALALCDGVGVDLGPAPDDLHLGPWDPGELVRRPRVGVALRRDGDALVLARGDGVLVPDTGVVVLFVRGGDERRAVVVPERGEVHVPWPAGQALELRALDGGGWRVEVAAGEGGVGVDLTWWHGLELPEELAAVVNHVVEVVDQEVRIMTAEVASGPPLRRHVVAVDGATWAGRSAVLVAVARALRARGDAVASHAFVPSQPDTLRPDVVAASLRASLGAADLREGWTAALAAGRGAALVLDGPDRGDAPWSAWGAPSSEVPDNVVIVAGAAEGDAAGRADDVSRVPLDEAAALTRRAATSGVVRDGDRWAWRRAPLPSAVSEALAVLCVAREPLPAALVAPDAAVRGELARLVEERPPGWWWVPPALRRVLSEVGDGVGDVVAWTCLEDLVARSASAEGRPPAWSAYAQQLPEEEHLRDRLRVATRISAEAALEVAQVHARLARALQAWSGEGAERLRLAHLTHHRRAAGEPVGAPLFDPARLDALGRWGGLGFAVRDAVDVLRAEAGPAPEAVPEALIEELAGHGPGARALADRLERLSVPVVVPDARRWLVGAVLPVEGGDDGGVEDEAGVRAALELGPGEGPPRRRSVHVGQDLKPTRVVGRDASGAVVLLGEAGAARVVDGQLGGAVEPEVLCLGADGRLVRLEGPRRRAARVGKAARPIELAVEASPAQRVTARGLREAVRRIDDALDHGDSAAPDDAVRVMSSPWGMAWATASGDVWSVPRSSTSVWERATALWVAGFPEGVLAILPTGHPVDVVVITAAGDVARLRVDVHDAPTRVWAGDGVTPTAWRVEGGGKDMLSVTLGYADGRALRLLAVEAGWVVEPGVTGDGSEVSAISGGAGQTLVGTGAGGLRWLASPEPLVVRGAWGRGPVMAIERDRGGFVVGWADGTVVALRAGNGPWTSLRLAGGGPGTAWRVAAGLEVVETERGLRLSGAWRGLPDVEVQGPILAVARAPGGLVVATGDGLGGVREGGDEGGLVALWGPPSRSWDRWVQTAPVLAVHVRGDVLAWADAEGGVWVARGDAREAVALRRGPGQPAVVAVALALDGQRVAWADGGRRLIVEPLPWAHGAVEAHTIASTHAFERLLWVGQDRLWASQGAVVQEVHVVDGPVRPVAVGTGAVVGLLIREDGGVHVDRAGGGYEVFEDVGDLPALALREGRGPAYEAVRDALRAWGLLDERGASADVHEQGGVVFVAVAGLAGRWPVDGWPADAPDLPRRVRRSGAELARALRDLRRSSDIPSLDELA